MRKMIINNIEVITNYEEKSAERLVNGEDIDGYDLLIKESRESTKEFLEKLVDMGYTRIRFAEVATGIRGIHDVVAYCKENDYKK